MSTSLLKQLTREQAALDQFLEVLNEEAAAMQAGRFDALAALTTRKTALLENIGEIDSLREQAQQALGFSADREGAHAAAQAGGALLEQAWEQLQASAHLARQGNHRNGVMIHTHLDFARQSLNFLQGGGQPLYGPDGSHTRGSKGNPLAAG
jgi:flagella synthesis protein FlgN